MNAYTRANLDHFMEQGADGWWRLPGGDTIPLMFSLKATKTS